MTSPMRSSGTEEDRRSPHGLPPGRGELAAAAPGVLGAPVPAAAGVADSDGAASAEDAFWVAGPGSAGNAAGAAAASAAAAVAGDAAGEDVLSAVAGCAGNAAGAAAAVGAGGDAAVD